MAKVFCHCNIKEKGNREIHRIIVLCLSIISKRDKIELTKMNNSKML